MQLTRHGRTLWGGTRFIQLATCQTSLGYEIGFSLSDCVLLPLLRQSVPLYNIMHMTLHNIFTAIRRRQ